MPELPESSNTTEQVPGIPGLSINTELYKIFYFVAREGSISKAAVRLYITQPAVSRTIHHLEDHMGCMLFFRTSKGVRLTNEGQILFNYVEQAFNVLSLGEKKLALMKNLESGEISIGVGDTICKHYLIPFLKQYNLAFPGIRIHIVNQKTFEIIRLLKNGKIDIGIINLPIEDEQLRVTKVMEIHDCFVTGSKYRYLSEIPISIKDLVRFPIMLVEKGSNSRKCIEEFFQNNGISIQPEFELGNFELLAQFAMIDFGIACVIKEFFLQEIEKQQLFEVPLKEETPARGIGVASLKVVPLSAAAKELIYLLMGRK